MPAPVKLRPHHLLCILTFVGKGYTPKFVANQTAIVNRINEGAEVLIVEGLDDICAALHDADGVLCPSGDHCLKNSVARRDEIALASVGAVLGVQLRPDSVLKFTAPRLAELRHHFADGRLRAACKGCEWHDLCSDIASDGFRQARLNVS